MDYLDDLERIIREFTAKNLHLSLAESCTGGYISHMITNISGASKVFNRGIVSYSNEAKIEVLKVDAGDIEKHGAVSEQVAYQMAKNVREQSGAEIGIGITGIAGPTGGTPEKPVGLVYVGYSTENSTTVDRYNFATSRIDFKKKVLEKVIVFLKEFI